MKEFELAGKKVTIEEVEVIDHDTTTLGRCFLPTLTVKIATKCRGDLVAQESKDQTLWHEITHLILDDIGRSDLSDDETFVQSFSTLLYGVVKTLK